MRYQTKKRLSPWVIMGEGNSEVFEEEMSWTLEDQ